MKTRSILLAFLAASSYAQTGTFTPTGNMTVPRVNHTATLLPDGKVLIAGGNTACIIGGPCLRPDHAELYDPATGTFTATANVSTAFTDGDSTALLNDGRVLLIGSTASHGSTAQLYDPVAGTFSPVANWPREEIWYPVALADGKVLLAPYDSVSGCEIYDPATGTFNLIAALGYFLAPPHRTLLLNGAVLFTGGDDGLFNTAGRKLYEPLTGTFAVTQSMSTPRDFHSATLLPDGTVLVAGGAGQSGSIQPPLASAEIYDPATRGFSTTGSLASGRHEHTATLLNNGQVLITGGTTFTAGGQCCPTGTSIDGMSSAELYTPAVLVPAPALFSTSGDGKGQGAIWHAQTGQIATADNPAAAGEALSMYTTSLADGSVITPQVIVGGRHAQVLYYGAAPGYPGYYQVNFQVPNEVVPGPAVSVRLRYLGRSSNEVSMAVQ